VLSGYGYGGSTTSAPSRNGDDSREEFDEKVRMMSSYLYL